MQKPMNTLAAVGLADSDRRLVDRCLAGEQRAWDELFSGCQGPLLAAIKARWGAGRRGDELAEEIAARIWFALSAGKGQLLARFDPTKGCRLTTYLASLAKHEALGYLRSEGRRRRRERANAEMAPRAAVGADETLLKEQIREFLDTLTPRERQFAECRLLSGPDAPDDDMNISECNAWQLRSRVRRKLEQHLGCPKSKPTA